MGSLLCWSNNVYMDCAECNYFLFCLELGKLENYRILEKKMLLSCLSVSVFCFKIMANMS